MSETDTYGTLPIARDYSHLIAEGHNSIRMIQEAIACCVGEERARCARTAEEVYGRKDIAAAIRQRTATFQGPADVPSPTLAARADRSDLLSDV